jgi:hypothetical protein
MRLAELFASIEFPPKHKLTDLPRVKNLWRSAWFLCSLRPRDRKEELFGPLLSCGSHSKEMLYISMKMITDMD